MPQRKNSTIITLPIGKIFLRAISATLVVMVLGFWIFVDPDNSKELTIDLIVCTLGLFLSLLLLLSRTIEYEKFRAGFKAVAPGLWQGGLGKELFSFEKYDFDVVVDLRTDFERPSGEIKVPLGKKYINWPMNDRDVNQPEELEALTTMLAKNVATRKVAVFCFLGVNRSGLICAETARLIAASSSEGGAETKDDMFNDKFLHYLARDEGKE